MGSPIALSTANPGIHGGSGGVGFTPRVDRESADEVESKLGPTMQGVNQVKKVGWGRKRIFKRREKGVFRVQS